MGVAAVKTRGHNVPEKEPSELEDLYREDPLKACRKALRKTQHIKEREERMAAINNMLGMCGVEVIEGREFRPYWGSVVAEYCNTGDTYALTIMFVVTGRGRNDGKYIVSSWGDWFEKQCANLTEELS